MVSPSPSTTRRGVLGLSAAAMIGATLRAANAAPDGELRIGVHVSLAPTWFDPAETPGIITPFMLMYAMHDAMMKAMPGDPVAPCLTESWTMAPDGLSYAFTLRKGVLFHNGDALTAEDVKFSLERYRGAASKTLKERVAGVDIHDPHRLTIRLNEPWPDFLTFYAAASGAGWIVPKKYLQQVGDDGFKKAPVGAGPYKFVSFTPGVELVCEAFERYWRKVPAIKRLVFKVIPDEATRLAALQRGEIDIAYSIRGELADELVRTPGLAIKPAVGSAPFWLYFPEQWDPQSPWHDRRVRQATNLALDLKTMNEALTLGYSRLTGSIFPENFDFYWQPPAPAYDPGRARKLLAEAGHARGFDAGDYYCDASYANIGEVVLNNLREVGIQREAPPARARRLLQGLLGEEAEEHRAGRLRRLRQLRDARRGLRGEGRHLCLRQLSRHRCAVRRAGRADGPRQARGDPASPAAARAREDDLCADLAARVHLRRRPESRAIGLRADQGISLHGAL